MAVSEYKPTTVLSDGQYWWRVRARSAYGKESDWTSPWKVIVDTIPPPVPNLIAPDDNAITKDNTPSFDWTDSEGAVKYELQVDNSSDFSQPEINKK